MGLCPHLLGIQLNRLKINLPFILFYFRWPEIHPLRQSVLSYLQEGNVFSAVRKRGCT